MDRYALVLPATLFAVPLIAPTPTAALAQLGLGGTSPLVAVVALSAWLCEGWLLVITTLTLLERRSGPVARGAGQLLARIAPAPIRTAARIALGTTLLTGALGSGPATASPAGHGPTSGRAATAAFLDWPTPAPTPGLDWPMGTAAVTQASASPAAPSARPTSAAPSPPPSRAMPTAPAHGSDPVPRATASVVVVQPGDCLWSLAARSLGPSATTARTAATWPSWWSTNRAVIGDDPDLLQPGTRLVPPA